MTSRISRLATGLGLKIRLIACDSSPCSVT